jgi:hypothetical protein
MSMLTVRITKVENGFVISVSGGEDYHPSSRELQYCFNTWEAASGFISSLNDRFK